MVVVKRLIRVVDGGDVIVCVHLVGLWTCMHKTNL